MSAPEIHELERRLDAFQAELTALKAEVLGRLSAIDGERGRISTILIGMQNKADAGHKLLGAQISLLMQMVERIETELAADADDDFDG